ncbi:MAG: hypothetical protein ACREBC_37370, partial [Pyrinomonadaceae bacterium]
RRGLGGAIVLVLGSVPVALAVATLLPRFLRSELLEAVPVFLYFAASMILLTLQAPLEAACHYLMRPKLVSLTWLMRSLFIGVAGMVLAPDMGAIGAAIAQLIGSALALLGLGVLMANILIPAFQKRA